MNLTPEPLSALLRGYAGDHEKPREVQRVCFDEAVQRCDDPLHILPYLSGLGIVVETLEDLLLINRE